MPAWPIGETGEGGQQPPCDEAGPDHAEPVPYGDEAAGAIHRDHRTGTATFATATATEQVRQAEGGP